MRFLMCTPKDSSSYGVTGALDHWYWSTWPLPPAPPYWQPQLSLPPPPPPKTLMEAVLPMLVW